MTEKKYTPPTVGRIIWNLTQILLIMVASYIVMVFISHFSVYGKTLGYHLSDSFKAMLLKTDVPAEFFLYFGFFIFLTELLALLFLLLTRLFSDKR